MISPRIRFHDLDPAAWRNVQRLLSPPPRIGGPRHRPTPPLILLIERGVCVKALRPGGDPVRAADFSWQGAWSLGRLRRGAGAPWALAIEDDAMERVAAAFEGQVRASEDLVAQGLHVARAARAELGRGLHLDPDPLRHVPVPPYTALQKTLDALLPDGRAAVLVVFDENRGLGSASQGPVWTSVILEKQGGDIVRVTTHAALHLQRLGFRQGAHREILDAVAREVARPHLGLFLSLSAWREVVGPTPGALARQVALGEAVIDPMQPWLVALAGVGAMAGVAQEASRLFGRFVPQSVKDTARAMSPFAALGFDPIEVFIELRKVFGGQ